MSSTIAEPRRPGRRLRPVHPYALHGEVGEASRRFLLRQGTNRIGSSPSSDVLLPVRGVSKRHALLTIAGGWPQVEDLASKNGTFVNGSRIGARDLRPGDEIQLGPVRLRLVPVSPDDGELAIFLGNGDVQTPEDLRETSLLGFPASSGPLSREPQNRLTTAGEPRIESLVFPRGHIPARSPAMIAIYHQMAAVARTHLPVLILGETGVGKEGIARCLHDSSHRADGPFVPLNCAAIPDDLLEAELFGIGKGVATGVAGRPGVFQTAAGGTLFLDEVGDMPPPMQAALLRTLQENEIHPLGRPPRPADVRIVAATNTALERSIAEGRFRRDLFYRLAGITLRIPPLRHREEDIPPLVEAFLRASCQEAQRRIPGMTVSALRHLARREWPGNVRELEHAIRRLVLLCPEHQPIDTEVLRTTLSTAEIPRRAETTMGIDPPATAERFDPADLDDLDLEAIGRQIIREALGRSRGNKTHAARLLGISREALRRRLLRMSPEGE